MDSIATYQQVYDLLERVPAASVSWTDAFVSARLSLNAVTRFVETMREDPQSPLRLLENEVLSEELRKLNVACGSESINRSSTTKFVVKIRAVLSPSEQQRVTRIVGSFCQPSFDTSKRFGKNGHAVMNAVRRLLTGYGCSKIPSGATVVEIGPDVANWILSPSPGAWKGNRLGAYTAARPILTPRDGVRMTWAALAAELVTARSAFYDDDTVEKAKKFEEMRERVFPSVAVPSANVAGEFIVSFDSNYDIKFSDMPVAMALAGARAWYGTMVRAKGLTSSTRLREGSLPLMGVNYRVDWNAGRIDFRHPECNAFGYSHNVYEYMKYEERNGYIWSAFDCDYIYTKGPETTEEILFFSVVRVPKLNRMYEPRFTENPKAGMLRLRSLWGVGGESGGLPSKFEAVEFHVDALNFWKILEKRRAHDHRGDISITLGLVRSTNVKFYMHGTPIGVNERIAARLAPATAIVVEAMVHEQRLADNSLFEVAMYQFDIAMSSSSWLVNLLGGIIDFKVATGKVVGSVCRTWHAVRDTIIDAAIKPLSDVKVGCEVVEPHVSLGFDYAEPMAYGGRLVDPVSECGCAEIADLRAAIVLSDEDKKPVLQRYLDAKVASNACKLCILPDILETDVVEEVIDSSSESEPTDYSTDDTEVVEHVSPVSSDKSIDDTRDEFLRLETYLIDNNQRECRVDFDMIKRSGPLNEATVLACTTGRTRHALLTFQSGRCVRIFGEHSVFSAMYDPTRDRVVPIRLKGEAMSADVRDGIYYSCNRMEVWNCNDIIAAVEYSARYGQQRTPRHAYSVVLGVPGAGKTYTLMSDISSRWKSTRDFSFLVLAVTNESARAAIKYGQQFGMDLDVLESRVMTLDKYLMHKKFPTDFLCIDEFPMVHMAKVDAAVAISSASTVFLYGDARQIPYDPFCAEFPVRHATIGDTIKESNVVFLPKTHRLSRDVCAMWIDQYPAIYPCDCCNMSTKNSKTLSYERVGDISHMKLDAAVRYHTYLRDERDDLRVQMNMRETKEVLRAKQVGGLSTVHEDQGSTHERVVTVRLTTTYDKNASKRNPSLFNRCRYVLTDTTRHTHSYHYVTLSDEFDLIMQRIDMSKDIDRLEAVDKKISYGNVTIASMIN